MFLFCFLQVNGAAVRLAAAILLGATGAALFALLRRGPSRRVVRPVFAPEAHEAALDRSLAPSRSFAAGDDWPNRMAALRDWCLSVNRHYEALRAQQAAERGEP
jgi:hypothetical protein